VKKFAILFSICVLTMPFAACQGGLYLEIVDGQLVLAGGGDCEVVMISATEIFNIDLYSTLTLAEGVALPGKLNVIAPIWDSQVLGTAVAADDPFGFTIDNLLQQQVIEVPPLDYHSGKISFDPELLGLNLFDLSGSLYVIYVPEPACLQLFGIGGFLIRKRISK